MTSFVSATGENHKKQKTVAATLRYQYSMLFLFLVGPNFSPSQFMRSCIQGYSTLVVV